MRKTCLLFLCLLLALSGCAVGTPAKTTQSAEPADAAVIPTPQEQAALILSQRAAWEEDAFLEGYYTITDLDHNGRLEVFSASCQGTGIYTWGAVYEVSEDFQTLTKYALEETVDLPDVILEKTKCYHDSKSGTYLYPFRNDTKNGAAEYWTGKQILSLENGALHLQTLAWEHTLYTQNGTLKEYGNANGVIPPEEFEQAFEKAGEGMQSDTVRFAWVHAEELDTPEAVYANYQVFAGERKLSRPAQMDLYAWPEGIEEIIPANLVRLEDSSLYIPEENWIQRTQQMAGETAAVFQFSLNADIQLIVVRLPGADEAFARSWVHQQYPEYTFPEDPDGLAQTDRNGRQFLYAEVQTENGNAYLIIRRYPQEAAEGAAPRMQAMADSFKID